MKSFPNSAPLFKAPFMSNVNDTLSNLAGLVYDNKKNVDVAAERIVKNTKAVAVLTGQVNQLLNNPPVTAPPAGQPVALSQFNLLSATADVLPIANTAFQMFPQSSIVCFPQSWTVSLYVHSGPVGIDAMSIARCAPGSLTVEDFTTITFAGSPTATVASTSYLTSDVIDLPIDSQHDYYFLVYGHTGNYELTAYAGSGLSVGSYMGGGVANLTTTNPIQNPPNTTTNFSNWIVSWLAA